MDARQLAFRAEYQAKISPYYNGWLHGAWIFGFGLAYIGLTLSRVETAGWAWLSAVPALVVSNLGEWWLHKYALHRRIDALRALWHRHTVEHHSYFTEARMTVDSHREYRIIFFPPYAIVGIGLIHALFGLVWGLAFGVDAMWIWMAGGMLHYLAYEVLHTAAHLPENRWLARLPLVSTMRRNHWVHHHQALMTDYNLNLTVPFADWLFGTSDLTCGLWGILCNGYRMDRLKPEVAERLRGERFP
ncbi:Fatty acid hydroxylase superfamily protein [Fontimonas thermophila]|uniref:Fatty acid hydroxylase superfamily protein n=1 Tax=Fontimonas thermophila TaxID=1076937 RepID=A0A1I2KCZ5_9GAMM|nr:sterol desaturase family protein [Fontimonas thermophila]SFF62816.1 Fatty acid hydroxylase superfamily protein [Fontimonas thermophila]